MKHFFSLFVAFLAIVAAHAQYSALSFKTIGGDTHNLSVEGLEITFTQENLTVSNTQTSISLPITQLESMSFIDPSALGDIISDISKSEHTTIYNLSGVCIGSFPSMSEAIESLSAGCYILKFADGTTFKISKK